MRRHLSLSVLTLALTTGALAGCGALVDGRADKRETAIESAYPPTGQMLEVNGVQVHAEVVGQGPDIVLLHGASGNLREFTFAFADALKDRYRVIMFDRPGLGYSGRTDPSYASVINRGAESPAEQAALLSDAARRLGAENPIVLGHSFGGAVALAWAVNHPDHLSGLVVVAGASNPWPGSLGPFYRITSSTLGGATVVPLATAFAGRDSAGNVIDSIFEPQEPPEGYSAFVGAPLAIRRDAFRANARQVNGLRPHLVEMAPRYAEIDVPTEIVHGTADEIVPLAVHSEKLVTQIPDATLTRLDGIGHMPHHVAQDDVIAAIDRAARRAGLR